MIRLLVILLAIQLPHLGLSNPEIRSLWFKLDDAKQKKNFIAKVDKQTEVTPAMDAYRAAACMMKAEFTALPNEKLHYFNTGKNLLEKCLQNNPWNTECRFIRLTLQCKSPWFLGYHDNIEEDAQVVLDHFKLKYITTQNDYWNNAKTFMLGQSQIPDTIKKQLLNFR